MFDLNPVRLAARSNYVKFTDEVEENATPSRSAGSAGCSGVWHRRAVRALVLAIVLTSCMPPASTCTALGLLVDDAISPSR